MTLSTVYVWCTLLKINSYVSMVMQNKNSAILISKTEDRADEVRNNNDKRKAAVIS
ncbi:hypothetical protein T12_8617 [Trichinella patagoniensis]|nr:hypothetical protein T12_8617 [Trichinella patagoniensis]